MAREKRYKVIYDRNACIGAAACVMASAKHWKMDDEGKAILKESKKQSKSKNQNEIFELEITQEEYKKMFEAAKVCPAACIHIIDKKTGKRLI